MISYFETRINEFKAGSLKHYASKWQNITADKEILETV